MLPAFEMITQVILLAFLQQACSYNVLNDNTTSQDVLEYVLLDNPHPCIRTCVKGAPPMVCRYNFKVEWYKTLSRACYDCPINLEDCKRKHCIPGDGYERPVIAFDRQIPGPTIEVCFGDEVIVDVTNHLLGDTTSVHWHGFHQKGSPYMDGVPMLTQCPILPGTTFRYHFVANNVGTQFWHSHTDVQRGDGAFGPFIVRQPPEDNPHEDMYDFDLIEHIMVVHDWDRDVSIPKFVNHYHSLGDNRPATLLVNGLGRDNITMNGVSVLTPTARFYVKKGYRYRFRIINAEFLNCPIEMSFDNHTMAIIATDGNYIKPIAATSLVLYAGERFDIVINANQTKGLYWIKFRGLMDCDGRFKSAYQLAVLQYDGQSNEDYPDEEVTYNNAHNEGLQVNALNLGPGQNDTLCISELQSIELDKKSLQLHPDLKYFVSYDFYAMNNPAFHDPELYPFENFITKNAARTPQLNHISLQMPPFPLLSQRYQIPAGMFCNETNVKNCDREFCQCIHVIETKLGSLIEVILIDKGFVYNANHPFHLHGHSFYVVAMEKVGEHVTLQEVEEMDKKGLIKRNLVNPPLKDTVTVPDGGFTIIRFVADNPGYWLFHCHIDFHAILGMAIIFKFGEDHEMPPVPKGFPQCGNYMEDSLSVNPSVAHSNVSNSAISLQINYVLFISIVLAIKYLKS